MQTRTSDDSQGTAYLKQIAANRTGPALFSGNLLSMLKKRSTIAQQIAARFAASERLSDGTWITDACEDQGECGVHYHGWRYEFSDGSAIVVFDRGGFEVARY